MKRSVKIVSKTLPIVLEEPSIEIGRIMTFEPDSIIDLKEKKMSKPNEEELRPALKKTTERSERTSGPSTSVKGEKSEHTVVAERARLIRKKKSETIEPKYEDAKQEQDVFSAVVSVQSGSAEMDVVEPEKKETEKKDPEKMDPEKKEPEKKEPEKKEPEKKESEKKEPEKKELERKEPEKNEPEKKELERKEPEKREAEKKELENKEPVRDELPLKTVKNEFKPEQMRDRIRQQTEHTKKPYPPVTDRLQKLSAPNVRKDIQSKPLVIGAVKAALTYTASPHTELLSKPKSGVKTPRQRPVIRSVKAEALNYVATERIKKLAQPKTFADVPSAASAIPKRKQQIIRTQPHSTTTVNNKRPPVKLRSNSEHLQINPQKTKLSSGKFGNIISAIVNQFKKSQARRRQL